MQSTTLEEPLSKIGTRVGYRSGAFWVIDYLDKQQGIQKTNVNRDLLGLQMLAANRLDLYIGSGMQIKNSIPKLTLSQPIYLVGVLSSHKLFPYLNRRHQNLATPLAAELKRLIEDRGGLIR